MKWPKDRRKAFLWAAKAFGTPLNKRTVKQRWLTSQGICRSMWQLADSEGSTWLCSLGHKMKITEVFWWPVRGEHDWTPLCDKERFLFCTLMAALSDEEFKELQSRVA